MSLLDQLWDDTVAGPRPDNGLGKLRKFSSFNLHSNPGKESEVPKLNPRSLSVDPSDGAVKVTRSIMILKSPRNPNKESPPVSPADATPPVSSFSTVGGRESYRFQRRSASFVYENARGIGPRSPPPPYL